MMDEDTIIRLPLKNKNGEVVAYTIVDSDDYQKIKGYTIHKRGSKKLYAVVSKDNTKIPLHHLILSKPEKGSVVDHINGDSLDNRKSNLQIASISQNNQNREKRNGCASKYIGVWKRDKKWVAECCNTKIGIFENEEDAAKAYDMYAYIKFGCNARTNNLKDYSECVNMTLEDCLNRYRKKQVKSTLPVGVYVKNGKYCVKVGYKNVTYKAKSIDSFEEAEEHLQNFNKAIAEQIQREEQKRLQQPILRNAEGIAVIPISNNNNNDIVAYAFVSDEDYYELVKYSWSLSNGYAVGRPQNGRKTSMHLHVFHSNTKNTYDVVDHINQNKLDNRRTNLRGNSLSGNAHNSFKKKSLNSTSTFRGVRTRKGKWLSEITKDKKYYYIGSFNTEKEAAIAYNNKATELYGDFACLNVITEDLE